MALLQRLPKKATPREFSVSLTYGFNHKGAMVSELVNIDHKNLRTLKPGADTSKAIAKRVWTTFRNNEYMLVSLNKWLSGGESFPFLNAFLGVAVGKANVPAGIAWSIFFAALDNAAAKMSIQCFVRASDQLWMIESIGLDGGDPTHVRQLWVVDPLRNGNSGPPASSWCIAEDRNDVVVRTGRP